MRSPSTDRRPSPQNLTPMIDVVFLLIIFFLVSSHLARREQFAPVQLPQADAGSPTAEIATATWTVSADGKVSAAGEVLLPSQFARRLATLKARHGAAASLRIRSDGRVPYEIVEPILRQAAEAGVSRTSLAVLPRES